MPRWIQHYMLLNNDVSASHCSLYVLHYPQDQTMCISVPSTGEVESNDPKHDEHDRQDLWSIERLTKAESAEKRGEDHAHAAPRRICNAQWHLAHNQWENGEA